MKLSDRVLAATVIARMRHGWTPGQVEMMAKSLEVRSSDSLNSTPPQLVQEALAVFRHYFRRGQMTPVVSKLEQLDSQLRSERASL